MKRHTSSRIIKVFGLILTAASWGFLGHLCAQPDPIRIGMIGIDTSHATAFTEILNNPQSPEHVPGGKVVAAVKQFSPDIESSISLVDGYVEKLKSEYGVRFFDTIEEMLPHVDAVMVESVDGRPHLNQARPAIEAGKPTFIDKPMAASLRDVIEIFELAKKHGTPVWSASNLRFHDGIVKAAATDVGELVSAFSWGPAPLEPHHPDLMWYGIHGVESLYTIMGTGCQTVSRVYTDGTDLVTGIWEGGRVGAVMGIRAARRGYGIKIFGTETIIEEGAGGAYPQLLKEVIKFFRTGQVPVSPETTIELFAFMEAADESKRRGGAPVTIDEVMSRYGK
ncbi:MAG TPA: Gfo/Idh/MocA family oxidoreductase [Acidobacteriota bacterium]|nr:Gfo/Idh/MocA family oxidoreductase [Acidobacteriota bacterium]